MSNIKEIQNSININNVISLPFFICFGLGVAAHFKAQSNSVLANLSELNIAIPMAIIGGFGALFTILRLVYLNIKKQKLSNNT